MYGMEHQNENKKLLKQIKEVDQQIEVVERKLSAELAPKGEGRMNLLNEKMDLINQKLNLTIQITETKRNWGGPMPEA